jgi:hypothetical protein
VRKLQIIALVQEGTFYRLLWTLHTRHFVLNITLPLLTELVTQGHYVPLKSIMDQWVNKDVVCGIQLVVVVTRNVNFCNTKWLIHSAPQIPHQHQPRRCHMTCLHKAVTYVSTRPFKKEEPLGHSSLTLCSTRFITQQFVCLDQEVAKIEGGFTCLQPPMACL